MLHLTDKGLSLIKRFEGFSPTVYVCPAGYWTIGFGHMLRAFDRNRDTRRFMSGNPYPAGITREEADEMLIADLRKYEAAVARLITVPLQNEQFDALVSFTYNLGAGALQRSTLRRKVNGGFHDEVPHEFSKWVWGGGRKLPGLVKRREAEAGLYEQGTMVSEMVIYPPAAKKIRQSSFASFFG